jgi:hypothetical protein
MNPSLSSYDAAFMSPDLTCSYANAIIYCEMKSNPLKFGRIFSFRFGGSGQEDRLKIVTKKDQDAYNVPLIGPFYPNHSSPKAVILTKTDDKISFDKIKSWNSVSIERHLMEKFPFIGIKNAFMKQK